MVMLVVIATTIGGVGAPLYHRELQLRTLTAIPVAVTIGVTMAVTIAVKIAMRTSITIAATIAMRPLIK